MEMEQHNNKKEQIDTYIAFIVILLFIGFYQMLTESPEENIEQPQPTATTPDTITPLKEETIEIVKTYPTPYTNQSIKRQNELMAYTHDNNNMPKSKTSNTTLTIGSISLPKKEVDTNRLTPKEIKMVKGVAQLINFIPHTNIINKESLPVLDIIASTLKKYPLAKIKINCHAFDAFKTEEQLHKLTVSRARKIQKELESRDIKNTISIQGYGSKKPLVRSASNQGRFINSRTELKIFY